MHTPAAAHRFLAQRRFAFVGVSHREDDFSRALFRDLVGRGYDVVPVNPGIEMADGRKAYARVRDVEPPVEAALLMTPPAAAAGVVNECAEAGVRLVWFHRGVGPGAESPEALQACATHGMEVVTDACPYMFLSGAGWFHRLHAFLRGLRGHRTH